MDGCPPKHILRLYADRKLSGRERAALGTHLERCPQCKRWVELGQTQDFPPGEPSRDDCPSFLKLDMSGLSSASHGDVEPSDPSWDMAPPGGRFSRGQIVANRYRIERFLGKGGMGEVWLVYDTTLQSLRALKIILGRFPGRALAAHQFDQGTLSRFHDEARVMARLNHENSVIIHDAELSGNQAPYIVMEYVPGKSLDKVLRLGVPMPLDWTARIVEQLCKLLDATHNQDPPVVHRDLKPSNLMLRDGRREGSEQLKVLDFGLAKTLAPYSEGTDLSAPGVDLVGTPAYACPEQWRRRPIDARSDLYCVGVILYEILTGYLPFDGFRDELRCKHIGEKPPTFRTRNPAADVPAAVEAVVMRCLEKDPGLRPQSAFELGEDFRRAAAPSTQLHEEMQTRPPVWPRWAVAVVLVGLLLVAGMASQFGSGRRMRPTTRSPLAPANGTAETLRTIALDLKNLPAARRVTARYFSLRHLVDEGIGAPALASHRAALAAAVNYVSRGKEPARLVPVDSKATVFRVDIHDALWDERPFVVGESTEISPIQLFDLVLLDYPYGVVPEPSKDFDTLTSLFLKPAQQVRPVPFVRGDWFVSAATRPPLYRDLLRLPIHLETLEAQLDMGAERESGPATMDLMSLPSGRTHGPHRERRPTRAGALWRTFQVPPGEIIFDLANGLNGFVHVGPGGILAITENREPIRSVLRGGLDCLGCHAAGLRSLDAVTPLNALLAADRTRHASAVAKVLGQAPSGAVPPDPISPVVRSYLDEPVTLQRAAAEVGLSDPSSLGDLLALPRYTKLELAPLAAGGTVGRAKWETAFPSLVRLLGLGSPIVRMDGLARLADGSAPGDDALKLSTNREDNRFEPGDPLFIYIKNCSGYPINAEFVGVDDYGRMTTLPSQPVTIAAGATYRYPPGQPIVIQPVAGRDRFTVFASTGIASAGTLLRSSADDVGDRFLHRPKQPGYDAPADIDSPAVFQATIEIETVLQAR